MLTAKLGELHFQTFRLFKRFAVFRNISATESVKACLKPI